MFQMSPFSWLWTNNLPPVMELITEYMTNYPFTGYFVQGSLLSLLIWMIYVEFHVGGIFVRPGSDGESHFNPLGIIPMMTYPFRQLHFWVPSSWDLNWIIFSGVGGLAFAGLQYYLKIYLVSSS